MTWSQNAKGNIFKVNVPKRHVVIIDDELKSNCSEFNAPQLEFKQLKASQYYTSIPETIQGSIPEGIQCRIPEITVDVIPPTTMDLETPEQKQEEKQEQYDEINKYRNSADGTQSPDASVQSANASAQASGNAGSEAAADSAGAEAASTTSGAAASSSGAAASSASAGASTVASLAGGATVTALAAVAFTTVAVGIVNKAPNIVSEKYETGTNYLVYEIELAELTEGASYVIRVTGKDFKVEYPVVEEGINKQLVTGLEPYQTYDVKVIGDIGAGVEYEYNSATVTTNRLAKPKAVFEFTPIFDYVNGTYDIEYSTYISDFYKTGKNTYLQIYIDQDMVVDDHNLPADNFFKGVLASLTDITYLEATVYTDYYDEYNTVIGTYGYRPEYPEDFNFTPRYDSTYDVQTPTVTYGEEGYSISIDTGFVPQSDEDSYIIDIYEGEEAKATGTNLLADTKTKIASFEGTDKVINVTIPGDVNNIDIYFTGVKTKNNKKTLYDTKKIYSYSFAEDKKKAPAPTATVEFTEDYDPVDDIYNVDYSVNLTDIFYTGSNFKVVELIDNEVINEIILEKNEYKSSFNTLANGVNIAVIVYCNYNGSDEQIVIGSDEKKIEYPEPFKDIEYLFKNTSYSISMAYAKEDANKTFNLHVVQNNKDKTTIESDFEFVDICSYEGVLDGMTMADVESFNISVSYKDTVIKRLVAYPNGTSFEVGEISADEDGNIIIPYEAGIPTGGEFVSGSVLINGVEDAIEIDKLTGSITLTSFDSNILSPVVEIKYTLDDITITNELTLEDINIGADIEVSYYATHYDSYYDYVSIKFDAVIDGKNANINVNPLIADMVDSELSYVKIEDRNVAELTTGTYRDYYIVKVIEIGDEYGISYKIGSTGFDSEAHNIIIDKNMANDNNVYNFTAGYVDNGEYYINYAKTENEDGTVNYYFNTNMDGFSENHYGRIEYSYKEDNTTKYLYTDFFNAKTFSLLGIEDKEYEFTYAVYYKHEDVYYDLNIVQTSGKTYSARQVKIVGIENETATIAKLNTEDGNAKMVIDFSVYEDNVDKTKPFTVTYAGTVVNIDLTLEAESDPTTADGSGSNGWESDDHTYGYLIARTDGTTKIEVYKNVEAIEGTIPYTAEIAYTAIANDFIKEFPNMIGSETLSGSVDKTIGEYTGTVDLSKVTVTHTDATLESRATITVSGIEFTSVDSRDQLKVVAYSNGEAIMTEIYVDGPVVLNIDPAYTNVDLKIIEIKNQYVETIGNYNNLEMIEIEYNITELEPIEFEKVQIIDYVELVDNAEVNALNIAYSNQIMTFDDYRMEVLYYYTLNGVEEYDTNALENGVTECIYSKHDTPVKLVINIYKDDEYNNAVLCDSYEIPFTFKLEVGSVDVDDNGNVLLPYEITIPEDAILNTDEDYDNKIKFTGMEDEFKISESTGTISIKEIDTNILTPELELNYTYNGVKIHQLYTGAEINLGAEVEVSYYATHYNSQYSFNIKFDTLIDGKTVNANLKPQIYKKIETVSADNPAAQTSEYKFVAIDEALAQEKYYFGYYVVDVDRTDDPDHQYQYIFSLQYKITNDGFDNETHTIDNVYSYIREDSNYSNYNAGYSDNFNIEYVKTLNDDGTANYYFLTGLEELSSGHYGRIEYNYTVDGKTKYLESDYSTDSIIKLLNIPDRDYTFRYATYYKYGDSYYDLKPRFDNNNISSSDTYYTCTEKNASSSLNLNNATIAVKELSRDTYATVITFQLNPDNIDQTSPIVVNYNGSDISIPYKEYDPDDATMESVGDGGYRYEVESDNTSYKVTNRIDVLEVSIAIQNIEGEAPKTATVNYNGGPNDFLSLYEEINGSNDIINSSSLSADVTLTIGSYTGEYDFEKIRSVTNQDSSGNSIDIYVEDFTATDSRDTLLVLAYSGSELVAQETLSYGNARLNIEPGYTKVDVKIVEIKNQEFVGYVIDDFTSYQIKYKEIEYKSFEFEQLEMLDNIAVSNNEEGTITVNITPTDTTEFYENDYYYYYFKVEQFYKMSSASNETSVVHTTEKGDSSVAFDEYYQTTKAIVRIYKHYNNYGDDDVYIASYEISLDAEIGDYIYNDGHDYISLPCELKLPEGAVLDQNNTSVTYGTQDPQYFEEANKNIIINSLESNVVDLKFNVLYTQGSTTINAEFNKKHEIESEVTLDYAIYSVLSDSGYGNFSCLMNSAKYDTETGIVYISKYIDEETKYLDSNGNEAPSTAVDIMRLENVMYYLKGDLKTDIGCFTNLPYQGPYTINVTKAGGNIYNTSDGSMVSDYEDNPPNKLSQYIEQSSDITGIYMTFLHTTLGYTFDNSTGNNYLYGTNKCELEFEISNGETVIATKSIEFVGSVISANVSGIGGTYTNTVFMNTNYINQDYLNGTKNLVFNDAEIDLTNTTTSQTVASNTVTIEDLGNGILKIMIESSESQAVKGNLVVDSGNSETGYTEITYAI